VEKIYSVSEFNRMVKSYIDDIDDFQDFYIEGEISNLKLDIQNRSFKDKNELLEQQKEIDLELKEHKEKFDKNKFNLIANEKLLNYVEMKELKLYN